MFAGTLSVAKPILLSRIVDSIHYRASYICVAYHTENGLAWVLNLN